MSQKTFEGQARQTAIDVGLMVTSRADLIVPKRLMYCMLVLAYVTNRKCDSICILKLQFISLYCNHCAVQLRHGLKVQIVHNYRLGGICFKMLIIGCFISEYVWLTFASLIRNKTINYTSSAWRSCQKVRTNSLFNKMPTNH